MSSTVVHLSDVHFALGRPEQQPAWRPFLEDLKKQLRAHGPRTLVVISGDIAQAGSDTKQYDECFRELSQSLEECGIDRSNRICVPGNHDVDRNSVEGSFPEHNALVSGICDELSFNKFAHTCNDLFHRKFANYQKFEDKFAAFGISQSLAGGGHSLSESVGVYCANSALFSSAGVSGANPDRGNLAISTRNLAEWLNSSVHNVRIFVGHHPSDWMQEWCKHEMDIYLRQFTLVLHGHVHERDSLVEQREGSSVLYVGAPALLTRKGSAMGYSIISISDDGRAEIEYRQWDERSAFVLGTALSGTDSGKQSFNVQGSNASLISSATKYFKSGLRRSLRVFGDRSSLQWLDPHIYNLPEAERGRASKERISVSKFVDSLNSWVVKAPPQYGLTSLGWEICRFGSEKGESWLRVDLSITKPHDVRADLATLAESLDFAEESINGIVVDGWESEEKNAKKCLSAIKKKYPAAKLIVLSRELTPTLSTAKFIEEGMEFTPAYLWSFSRADLRSIVTAHCRQIEKQVSDVEALFQRVVKDLDWLNLPRTPLNCLMLLLVSGIEGDSIVNRAEVIRGVLTIIFQSEAALTYRSRADMKDCEHVLGAFAEMIIRSGDQLFTEEEFLKAGKAFCERMLVDVDVRGVLGLLREHDIIIDVGKKLCFRFSYWIYYFAAARMHHDQDFASFVLSDMQYTRFPEVIEFYAGIDRCRKDALVQLKGDLRSLHASVNEKANISSPGRLYELASWGPSKNDADEMMRYVEQEVLGSNLPQEVKD